MDNDMTVIQRNWPGESNAIILSEQNLPELLQGQIDKLNELDKSVQKAIQSAEEAKQSAAKAKQHSAGWNKKKGAIEELQSAGVSIAEAVHSEADAQKISFQFQTKLAEISKYLFGLGVSNITMNRMVVRQLELKLKGASQNEISALARQELLTVVKQLKDQEDILKNIENIFRILKEQKEILNEHEKEYHKIDEILSRHDEINNKNTDDAKANSEAIIAHENQIKEHDVEFNNQKQKIDYLQSQNKLLMERLGKAETKLLSNQKITLVATLFASISLVLSFIRFIFS